MRTIVKFLIIIVFLFIYSTSFAEIDVFVDPGHGGSDPGHGGQNIPDPCGAKTCVFDAEYGFDSCADGYYCEKHINLEVILIGGKFIMKNFTERCL